MRGIRLFVIVLMMSILIVPFISCSKTEDQEKQTSTTAERSAAPAQHEVVSNVYEFFKAIDSGDYDRAIELGAPNEFNQEELILINRYFDFKNVEIAQAYVGNKNSAVLTSLIPTIDQAKKRMRLGCSLVKSGNRWLISRLATLYYPNDAQEWIADFKDVEPAAKHVAGSD